MPEQPNPEPQKSNPESAPKAAPSSFNAGADASRASAYVPLPGGSKGKNRAMLALAALIAAGALAGTALYVRAPSGSPSGVIAAVKQEKTLFVSDADINVAATERVRKADPSAAAPAVMRRAGTMGEGPVTMGGGGPLPPAALPPVAAQTQPPADNRASSPLPTVPPELMNPPVSAPQSALTPQGQVAVRADGYSIFSMQLIDDVAEDGDVVQISVDGVPVSFLSLSHAGATLDIPLKKGESHQIKVTAVRDGTGGVTLGLRTSVGDVVSRNLQVGESDSWTIGFK